jgi:hypothetical protein
MSGAAEQPSAHERPLRAHLIFFQLFLLVVVLSHWPWFDLLPHWDEIGWFLPAALDLYRDGHWIPVSTPPSPHPPGLAAYLAAVWSVTGYSITAARLAMCVLGASLAYVTFLLGIRLCRDSAGAPALSAVLFLLVSPLFYTQSMMTQLDLPAALFTITALLLFLEERIAAAAAACVVLVLVKETGIVLPAVLGGWLISERRYRDAVWFSLPGIVLTGWFIALYRATGHWFGNPSFAEYNLAYPLHPFRLAAGLARRLYALGVGDMQWLGTLAIVGAWRKRLFQDRAWKVTGTFVAAHVAIVTLMGGAQLERYLLPVWPLVFIAAARGFAAWSGRKRIVAPVAMALGLLAGLFLAPPYPFPYENSLAMTDFVNLHRGAAQVLQRRYPDARVATAWPFSDALRHPEFGYVDKPLRVVESADFRPSSLSAWKAGELDVLVLYEREWDPPFNLMRAAWVESLWRRYFDYQPPVTTAECARRFGLRPVTRLESRGQWLEVLARWGANSESTAWQAPNRTNGRRGGTWR